MIGRLTTRERDAIRRVGVGASNKEVADRLGLKASTVKSHVSSILWKLEAGSRTEAAIIALRAGLVDPPTRQAHPVPGAPAPPPSRVLNRKTDDR